MKSIEQVKQEVRHKRAMRVRRKLRGNTEKPRLSVFKSNQHIAVQLIDDETGRTLGSAATFDKDFKGTQFNRRNKASARKLGQKIADVAKKHNVHEVIFDRGPFKYHGILAELAEGARESGLKF